MKQSGPYSPSDFPSSVFAPPGGQGGGNNQIAGGRIFFGGGGKIIGGLGIRGDTSGNTIVFRSSHRSTGVFELAS